MILFLRSLLCSLAHFASNNRPTPSKFSTSVKHKTSSFNSPAVFFVVCSPLRCFSAQIENEHKNTSISHVPGILIHFINEREYQRHRRENNRKFWSFWWVLTSDRGWTEKKRWQGFIRRIWIQCWGQGSVHSFKSRLVLHKSQRSPTLWV